MWVSAADVVGSFAFQREENAKEKHEGDVEKPFSSLSQDGKNNNASEGLHLSGNAHCIEGYSKPLPYSPLACHPRNLYKLAELMGEEWVQDLFKVCDGKAQHDLVKNQNDPNSGNEQGAQLESYKESDLAMLAFELLLSLERTANPTCLDLHSKITDALKYWKARHPAASREGRLVSSLINRHWYMYEGKPWVVANIILSPLKGWATRMGETLRGRNQDGSGGESRKQVVNGVVEEKEKANARVEGNAASSIPPYRHPNTCLFQCIQQLQGLDRAVLANLGGV